MNYLEEPIFKNAYNYVLENNEGNKNPYHNNKHMLDVFKNSMMLFDIYRKEYGFKYRDRIEIGLAALFHDFNHSGGKLKDHENIDRAIVGLEYFLSNEYEPGVDIDNITSIIEATEFPHKNINLTNLQKIIRDADMLSSITDNWFEQMVALSSEFKKSLTNFIPIQINFVNSVEFYTPYCKKVLTDRRERMIKEILKLQSELTSHL
jgi:hypothetical protein